MSMHSLRHLFQSIRHSVFWKRLSHHHWWVILTVFVLLNCIIGYLYFIQWISKVSLPEIRQEWNYALLAQQQNAWWTVGLVKLWAIEQWGWRLLTTPNTQLNESILPIKKAFFLESKWDSVGAEQLLSLETHEDAATRALYLALRAYFYCTQNKYEECSVLAEDSVILDPLAPIWLQIQWVAFVNQRKFVQAKDAFERAQKIGGLCTSSICLYHRWLTSFYTTAYESAQSDLSIITWDQMYWNNALLFLWRIAYNKQQWTWAVDYFTQVITNKSWSDWNAELWLARVDNAQWKTQQAFDRTNKTYTSWWYGIELLTDMVQYAHLLWNQSQVDILLQEIQSKVWTSLFAHLIVTRALISLWYFDLAWQYLQMWLTLTQQWEDDDQKQQFREDFEKEWLKLWMFQLYNALQKSKPTEEMIMQLQQKYENGKEQIAFFLLLQQMIQRNSIAVWTWIETIPVLQQNDERTYVLIWWDLLNDQPIQALERLVREFPWWENTPRHLWIKRAITKRLWQQELSRWYEEKLRLLNSIDENDERNDQFLRKKAFTAFDPWLLRMYPYLSPDRLWQEEWTF